MNRIYLDYAASTLVDPRVERAMRPYFLEKFGNPGSLHSFGQEAIAAVDESRETIAKAIGADFREVIFTGSATEANNLALRGAVKSIKYQISSIKRPRIIVSAIEHESVLETARDLECDGVEVVYLPVDLRGIVDLKKLKESLNERTVLVSIMYANNEIGVVQPIAEISDIIRNFRVRNVVDVENVVMNKRAEVSDRTIRTTRTLYPLLHTDAAQAFQFLDCDVNRLGVDPVRSRLAESTATTAPGRSASNGVDLMTLSAHKIYGPKGIGALYVSQQIANRKSQINKRHALGALPLAPLTTGGGQEFGLRSGTESVPLIVGFAKAVELISNFRQRRTGALARHGREFWNKRIGDLRDHLWRKLKKITPAVELNGDLQNSLPNILSVYFPNYLAEELLTKFDLAGLAASSGSACRSRAMESSYVIEALGYSKERAKKSIRFSFGRPTTKGEIEKTLRIMRTCF